MKNLKRILSVVLIASMIFTSNAMITLAESAEGATITETISEETISIEASSETVIVEASETAVAASETTVGANTRGALDSRATASDAEDSAEENEEVDDDIAITSDAEEDNNVAADIEEIKIASASIAEIKTNDEELFGANTVYYAIAGNTATFEYTLYFSSSDLSGDTSHGTVVDSGTVGVYDDAADRPWANFMYGFSGGLVILDTIKPTSMKNWFYNKIELANNITGFNNIDTSAVTDMSNLFRQCFGLSSLDLSSWDTSNVTDMSSMFQDCGGLTSLNISSFNTSNVTNMSSMFNNCRSLTSLDVSHFDTSNVTDMYCMFLLCQELTSLDLSSFDTSNVTNMAGMLSNCIKLQTLTMPATFNASNVTEMSAMFFNDSALTSLDLSNFSTSAVTSMDRMFGNCSGLTTLDLSGFSTSAVTNMQGVFSGCSALTTLDLSAFNTNAVTNMNSMFSGCTGIDTITVSSDFVTTNVTDSTDMFANCTSLEGSQGTTLSSVGDVTDKTYARIDGGTANPGLFSGTATPPTPTENTVYYAMTGTSPNYTLYFSNADLSSDTSHGTVVISGIVGNYTESDNVPWRTYVQSNAISNVEILNTIKPTRMAFWFSGLGVATFTGLNNINTSATTNMTNLFVRCTNLSASNLGHIKNWDTSNVTSMSYMFVACTGLTNLDLSGWNTSHLTEMQHMFDACENLETVNLSTFDTSNVTNMSYLFMGCKKLTSFDLSNFNTSNVTKMTEMFSGCEALTSLDLSGLDTSNAIDMDAIFNDCKNLTTINLSGLSTNSATTIAGMFMACEHLQVLDLSSFNTNTVEYMNKMFFGCTNLTAIKVSNNFVTTQVTTSFEMFSGCTSLTGSQGSTLASIGDGIIDKTYARLDGGTSAPGLFTDTLPATPIEILSISGLPNPSGEGDHILPAGNVTALNLSNLKINVKNDDNSTSEINYTGHESDFTFEPATLATSTTSLKIKYRNTLEKTIDNIFVYATTDIKNITGVAHTPTKTVYATGEAFDPTGLEIQVTQFDGTTTTKTWTSGSTDFTFTPNPITAGTTGVTVKYGRYDNCTYVIPIVTVKKASTFTVNDGGIDKYYVAGETITAANFHNLTLNVTNEDNTTETITYATHPEYFTFNPALGTPLTSNQNDIKVTYGGKTISVPIVVEPAGNASGATEGTPPTRTNYTTGDPFDPRGLVITVTYPGGITKTIEYNDETKNDFTFSPNPFATPAEPLTSDMDHVTVIYKGATTNIPVTVRKEISTFTVINGPTNTEYSKGDKFDPTGIKVRLTFTDNTTEDIEYSDTTKDMFTFTPDLSHEFDNTDVGNKVQISISGLTPQAIDDMDEVVNDSVVAVMLDANGNPQVVHNISRDDFIHALDDAINNGAIGFHEYTADGINDAKNKYDKYAPKTMNKNEAIAKYDEYVAAGLTTSKFIAATYDRPVPEDITIPTDTPVKKTYTIGDTFDPTGLEIVATYEDGTTAVIKYTDYPDDFTFKPALNTKLTSDTDEIIVTYKGIVIHIPLTINKVNVSNIVVPSNVPVKRTYTVGDKFDPTGLAITVNYINGASEIIKYDDHKNEFTFNPSLNTTLTTRNTKIDITYAGKTISLALEVNEEINPNPEPYHPSGDGGNSGGGSDPSRGPMGDLTKNPEYANLVNEQGSREVNTSNNLPTTDLMTDTTLVFNLLAYPENAAAPKINAVDINGNQGYGQWQHVPGTTTWYFVSGNFSKPTEPVGFLRNGWYNLGWKGESNWYNFDNGGVMRIGWYQENNKIYYLEADLNSSWYGRAVVGTKVIGGITYNFGNDGVLIP